MRIPDRLAIVHITPSFAKGGGERVVIDLANEQAALGHDVAVIVGRTHGLAEARRVLDDRVVIKSIANVDTQTVHAYIAMLLWQLRHRTWLRSRDVIHCHLTMGAVFGTFARVLIHPRTRPVIIETYHAVGMAIPRWMRALHAMLASTRDGFVLMARDAYWTRFAERHAKMLITLVENGVRSPIGRVGSPLERAKYRHDIGIPETCRYVVGTVGQFRPDRQPWMHVEVFAQIAKIIGSQVYFAIAGDGAARSRVEADIVKAGLQDRIKLLGVTSSAAEPASIMDLYITLAVGPVVGIAALEAIFANVPTIAIQLNKNYIANEDDFVWSSQNLYIVAERAAKLLQDSESLRRMGAVQHAYALERYDMAAISRRYDEIYRELLENCDVLP